MTRETELRIEKEMINKYFPLISNDLKESLNEYYDKEIDAITNGAEDVELDANMETIANLITSILNNVEEMTILP